jgi:hypothetical protein
MPATNAAGREARHPPSGVQLDVRLHVVSSDGGTVMPSVGMTVAVR